MKVLLAIEPSRISAGAIRVLRTVRLPRGSDLYLLHVNPVHQKFTGLIKERILKITQHIKEIEKDVREQARQFLCTVETRIRGHQDVRFHTFVRKGFPGEEIVKTIYAQNVDLVVLGARGHSKTTGFFLGSVSQWVVHEAPCSVLIGRKRPSENKKNGGMNLLLATDGSPDAEAAVDFLNTVGLPPDSQLIILHVVKGRGSHTEPMPATYRTHQADWLQLSQDLIRIRRREGRTLLQKTRSALTGSELKIIERVAFGYEAQEILKAAKQARTDLIIMGSRGLTGFRRLFLGSVSDHVVHNAGCSVAVIRNNNQM